MKILVLVLLFVGSAEACLRPKFAFPKKYFDCVEDSDCVIYQADCRTCDQVWSVNKAFEAKLREADQRLRTMDKCQKTCEACDTKKLRAFCRLDACQVGPIP